MLAFYLHGSGGICRSTVRGGSRLSYINNHYGRTSSLPIVVFTSAHGCFYYSEQNAWDIGWEKHLFGAPRIVMSLLIGFLVMLEKWGRSICLFLSFGLLPINRESCFQLWPGEQHPAWQSLPGDLAPVTQSLGEQPPKNELPVSFRSLAALLRATGKHLHLITFFPPENSAFSEGDMVTISQAKLSRWQALWPSIFCTPERGNRVKSNKHRLKMLSKMKHGGELGQKGG